MKAIVSISKETRHIESVASVRIEIDGGYVLNVVKDKDETSIKLVYPGGDIWTIERAIKANPVDRGG